MIDLILGAGKGFYLIHFADSGPMLANEGNHRIPALNIHRKVTARVVHALQAL